MNETTTAHIELTAQYDIYQSYQAELREAKGDLETGRYRQALAGATGHGSTTESSYL